MLWWTTIGLRMVQCYQVRKWLLSPSLVSPSRMLEATLVRPPSSPVCSVLPLPHPTLWMFNWLVGLLFMLEGPHRSFNSTMSCNSLIFLVPRPTAIRISTNQVNPLMIRPVGSTVTLTCMADLDPAISDVPVTVNIQLSDPAGSPLATTAPSVSGSSYTIAATISSFGRSHSGVYTCTATVSQSPSNPFLSDSSSQSETFRVTTGEAIYST
jgi:hypothetical protein